MNWNKWTPNAKKPMCPEWQKCKTQINNWTKTKIREFRNDKKTVFICLTKINAAIKEIIVINCA